MSSEGSIVGLALTQRAVPTEEKVLSLSLRSRVHS